MELAFHEGLPELRQDVFPRVLGSFTWFGIWRNSRLLVTQDFLAFPWSSEEFCTPVLRLPDQGKVPEHHLIDSTTMPPRVALATTRATEPSRQTPDTHHFTYLQKHTMTRFCVADFTLLMIQSRDADVRVGWEQTQKTCSGRTTEKAHAVEHMYPSVECT